MKIVFSSLPGYGHTYPLLPLARAARAVGHDVIYATDERFHPLLLGLGFRTTSAGMPIREAFGAVLAETEGDVGELDPSVRVFNDLLPRSVAEDLLPVLRAERVDLVVYEAGNPGAGMAARHLGIPAVCHAHARAEAFDSADRWQQGGRELLGAVGAEFGVELPDGQYLLGDRYLDIYPSVLQETSFVGRPERELLRPVPFSEPGELPEIVLAERRRPLVYLTLGTVVGTVPALRAAIDGLSTLDVDVVAAVGPNISVTEIGALPGNLHLERWLPQGELLPLVDLAVHHGGSGTTLGTAGAGVPELFLPIGFDGFLNAGAVSATGAGRRLLPAGVEQDWELQRSMRTRQARWSAASWDARRRADVVPPSTIAETAAELLTDPDARQAAKAVAEEIAAMPSPEEVAARLPEFC